MERGVLQQSWHRNSTFLEDWRRGNENEPTSGRVSMKPAGIVRAVRMGWLKEFARSEVSDVEWTTADVVERIVKPRTEGRRCRFVELPEMAGGDNVGEAAAFGSHTWGARFHDLVAQLSHVFDDAQFVWIDIFAVCQHPGDAQIADLAEFVPLVKETRGLILCATHLPSLMTMERNDVVAQRSDLLPFEERKKCAFFRVWCLLELAAAAACGASVVMLVGESDGGAFVPKDEMLDDLYHLINVAHADATVESDKKLIFETLMPQTMGLDTQASIARVNQLARGAINGAEVLLTEAVEVGGYADAAALRTASRAVMQASIGNVGPLRALSSSHLAHAITGAAAAGFAGPLRELIDAGAPVEAPDVIRGRTPLMLASNGGHEQVVRELLKCRADVNAVVSEGNVGDHALPLAAEGGHPSVITLLIEAGADAKKHGGQALSLAAVDGHAHAIETLLAAGVSPDARGEDGSYAIAIALSGGHVAAANVLFKAGTCTKALQLAAQWTDLDKYPEAAALLTVWRTNLAGQEPGATKDA